MEDLEEKKDIISEILENVTNELDLDFIDANDLVKYLNYYTNYSLC